MALLNWGSNYEQAIRDDIDYVLEQLFQHDNTPPFVARQMIQRFTLSNPSPSYIYDVAQAFKNGVYTSVQTPLDNLEIEEILKL